MSDPPLHESDEVRARAVVTRLARRRPGGGHVVERAAILAAGSDFAVIETWILDHAGWPERSDSRTGPGLHADRAEDVRASHQSPRRFLLPPGALDAVPDRPN